MSKKNARQIWMVPLVLALAVLACSGAPVPTASPLPRPTNLPNPTATTAAPQPTAQPADTEAPVDSTATIPSELPTAGNGPTATTPADSTATIPADSTATTQPEQPTAGNGTAAAPFELSTTPYVHKTGAFTVTLPTGWTTDEQVHSVFVTSPDKKVSIEVLFDNVGVKLDAATLNTYITAVENNFFGSFDSYTADPFKPQSDGSIGVYKTLKLSDGTPQTVFSYYWQDGTVVYQQNFWVDSALYDTYVKPLLAVANSMQTDPAAGAKSTAYGLSYLYTDPDKLFQFSVPYAWTQAYQKGSNNSLVTFTSPDNHSSFQNFTLDDITTASTTDAGALAREQLASFLNITDLKVTADQVQPDGSHLLVWNSAAGGIDGELFYETRGKLFLELFWVVDSADHSLFKPAWTTLATSYAIPK